MSDWSKFTKRISIQSPKRQIFEAWASQKGLESWFLRSAVFTDAGGKPKETGELAREGDKYQWLWHGWSDDIVQNGEILETNGIDSFAFTFHDPMVVSIRIFLQNSVNICELEQKFIPLDDNSRKNYFVGCGEGWTFYLANLKSILEGGIDLRNKDERVRNVINS